MLTDLDIAKMQTQQEAALPDLLDVFRPVKGVSSIGSAKSTGESEIATAVPCRVTPMQMLEVLGEQARPVEVSKYIVRVAVGTPIYDRDVLVITSQDNLRVRCERVKEPRSYDTIMTLEVEILA